MTQTLTLVNEQPDSADQLTEQLSARLTIKEKWQGAVNERSGFVAIPMSLLRLQTKLKLTATDMVVLANLLAHWWDPARGGAYPRSTTIASRMGVAKRTVQRSTQKMVKAGLIQREYLAVGETRRRTFQFGPLAQRLAKDINLSRQLAGKESLGA